ncbi:hydrolase [Acrasis kona]|uniref:Hydrolase n=1 Tax=Acrasis kona TaxID=1008807 RepID=A0AAW2YRQ0_9EUKA
MSIEDSTVEHVVSRDGTLIGYLRIGSGPGIVLVQGAMGTAYNYRDLARALASDFTVYIPDRRGRGMSPKSYRKEHSIIQDVEDIDAILEKTGASRVYGLSSGAMITLEAARVLPRITKAAVYEPPFYPNGISFDGIRQINDEIERGDFGSALISSINTSDTGPRILKWIPKLFAWMLGSFVLWMDDRISRPYTKLRDMVPGIRYDFNVVGGMDGKMETFKEIQKPMLLISGSESAPYLLESIRKLDNVLPHSEHVELEGLDHGGSWNSSRGHPQIVADVLKKFFV